MAGITVDVVRAFMAAFAFGVVLVFTVFFLLPWLVKHVGWVWATLLLTVAGAFFVSMPLAGFGFALGFLITCFLLFIVGQGAGFSLAVVSSLATDEGLRRKQIGDAKFWAIVTCVLFALSVVFMAWNITHVTDGRSITWSWFHLVTLFLWVSYSTLDSLKINRVWVASTDYQEG